MKIAPFSVAGIECVDRSACNYADCNRYITSLWVIFNLIKVVVSLFVYDLQVVYWVRFQLVGPSF